MMTLDQQSKILFISTYPPVKCGIASFTQDLINALDNASMNIGVEVCALDKMENARAYKHPVGMVMDSHNLDSCIDAANAINRDATIKLVCIEHEFGLYGGEMGSYLLGFLALVEKPFIIRYHTVLPAPDPQRLKIVQQINLLADKVIVMTQNSSTILQRDYSLSTEKIIVIPHGTHNVSTVAVDELKLKYDYKDKLVLCTFGLLSPNKGIEKGILAMKEISARFPESIYVVLGQTHPNLIAQEGEKYRRHLQQLIRENNLQQNVRLVNEYVPVKKLMEYLALTDIYLFTSLDPDQAVSGTFLYAMSAGCTIISNSFVLAKEMLDDKTGIILNPGADHELAQNAIRLLENTQLRKDMGQNAFLKTRDTTWKKVSAKHIQLYYDILGFRNFKHTPVNQFTN
jgi:glycosyltransferase involved in cell wall biosynthesis